MASKIEENSYVLLFFSGCIFGMLGATLVWRSVCLEQEHRENFTRNISLPNSNPAKGKLNSYKEFQTSRRLQDQRKNLDKFLRKKVRILCWVMTTPNNYQTKAPFPPETWGRHCDKFLFVSDQGGEGPWELHNANISITGRAGLWHKVQEAFRFIHKNYRGEYDWVLKADDDTYINMDSLRVQLSGLDASESLLVGEQWRQVNGVFAAPSFVAGGAGYIFSRKAVDILVKRLNDNRTDAQTGCNRNTPTSEEEPMLGDCLEGLVKLVDTRDEHGHNTFHQQNVPEMMLDHRFSHLHVFLNEFQYWESNLGLEKSCCSSFAKSFHYMTGYKMFVFEYLIRKINPFDTSYLQTTNTNRSNQNI